MVNQRDFQEIARGCIHFAGQIEGARVKASLQEIGFLTPTVDGKGLTSEPVLFGALAGAFSFPDYFGGNWDALEECLRDLSWARAPGFVLFVDHAETLWSAHTALASRLVESWTFCAGEWARESVPFHLAFLLADGGTK